MKAPITPPNKTACRLSVLPSGLRGPGNEGKEDRPFQPQRRIAAGCDVIRTAYPSRQTANGDWIPHAEREPSGV